MRQVMDALTLGEATDPVNPVCLILSPIVHVRTRWNSKLYLLRRAKRLCPGFKLIVAVEEALREFELNTAEWENVDKAIDFLNPFEQVSTVMEGFKYPTLSLVVPLYNQLISDLKACSENSQKRSQLELLL